MAWVTGVMALTGGSVGSSPLVCLLKQTTLPLQFFQGSHGAACEPHAEWTLVIFLPDNFCTPRWMGLVSTSLETRPLGQ